MSGAQRNPGDTYAALLSRAASSNAHQLVQQLQREARSWERVNGSREYERQGDALAHFAVAMEAFTGDLLRARYEATVEDSGASGRVYRSLKRDTFTDDVV